MMRSVKQKILQYLSCCLVICANCCWHSAALAQPADYFRNPMDIPITLSANFGEIRTNHFHTGFDMRTNAETGYKVYASADGVISRIKVAAGGFGNALYITHPNGYMTVYGHLDRFNDAIAAYVKQQQYAKQSFEVDLFPDGSKFPVKKSDLIAYSGNSGASGGPHLHFEIRDASGETYPLNPATFYTLQDTIAPKITALYLYAPGKTTGLPVQYPIKKTGTGYRLVKDSVIVNDAVMGVALEAADYMNRAANDYGVFEYEVKLDGKIIYDVRFDRMDFANGRYVNAFTDYRVKQTSGKNIQRLFRLPGDHNNIYHDLVNDGKMLLADSMYHEVEVTATDAYRNYTSLLFHVKFIPSGKSVVSSAATKRIFSFNQPNNFAADSIQLNLPADILYEDLEFSYAATLGSKGRYSATHRVQDANTPVHDSYEIRILPRKIPPALRSKAVIAYDEGKGVSGTKTTRWDGNWLVAKAREFGYFYVLLDTTAPKIAPVNLKQNQVLTGNNIRFTISDDLSGIVSYKGMLDGQWMLMEYDPKNNRLQCTPDKQLSAGEHSLQITVADDVKNESVYVLKFKK
ncbi:MAG: M23 family metallopeptidase [Chitinophagales bacterium]|nr:M23 family metallopeptidase [Chitinophagales bacterium]